MTTLALVVMEPGAAWPGQIGDSTDLVAFSPCEDLLHRTERKLSALHRDKQNVRVAVLACNSTGGPTTQRRAQLARLLLGAVTSTACGRMIRAPADVPPLNFGGTCWRLLDSSPTGCAGPQRQSRSSSSSRRMVALRASLTPAPSE